MRRRSPNAGVRPWCESFSEVKGDVTRVVGHAASQDQIPECAHPGSVREHCASAESARASVSVIIPTYNMAWCLTRAVGKHFPLVHAGTPVAVVHAHASPTRMTNSLLLKFRGIRQLVQNHRADIVREHGRRHLFLWRLRIVRAFLEWQNEWAGRKTATYVGDGVGETLLRSSCLQYGQITREAHLRLTSWLESRFEQMYF